MSVADHFLNLITGSGSDYVAWTQRSSCPALLRTHKRPLIKHAVCGRGLAHLQTCDTVNTLRFNIGSVLNTKYRLNCPAL